MTKATLNIPIKGDHVLDENQNFSLTLNSLSLPNNVTIGNHYQAVVTIKENDCELYLSLHMNQVAILWCIMHIRYMHKQFQMNFCV